MNTSRFARPVRLHLTAAIATASLLAGCGTMPPNVLVFGTTTVTALDVSPGTTGTFGVTLGYKRHEAVWMPLMVQVDSPAGGTTRPGNRPNDTTGTTSDTTGGKAGNAARDCPPAVCPTLFQGTAGTAASGATGNESYSVLATFSGGFGAGNSTTTTTTSNVSAGADGGTGPAAAEAPVVNANVRQIFATGNAARLLAATSGPGLVSANARLPSAPAVAAAMSGPVAQQIAAQDANVNIVMSALARAGDDTIDPKKVEALAEKAKLNERDKGRVTRAATRGREDLRDLLELDFDGRLARVLADAIRGR